MAEAEKPVLVNVIAIGSLLVYFWLLFSVVSLSLYSPTLIVYIALLYPIVGMACSLGLLQYRRWSWYLAFVTWLFEGAVSALAVVVPAIKFGISMNDVSWFTMLLLIAIFRFASIFYFMRRKVSKLY
jgi:hypothetical protein